MIVCDQSSVIINNLTKFKRKLIVLREINEIKDFNYNFQSSPDNKVYESVNN